jgi:hypothetical protein
MTDGRVYSTMYHITPACIYFYTVSVLTWGHRGRDCMIFGFITSDSLVEETEAPGENHRHVVSHEQTLMSHRVHLIVNGIRTLV